MAICAKCKKAISASRRRHAKYCGEECYLQAKRDRSVSNYNRQKGAFVNFRKNEQLLSQFYPFMDRKEPIHYSTLNALGFDWGISEGESQDADNNIWKMIGRYYYYINPDKTISIWKNSTQSPTK